MKYLYFILTLVVLSSCGSVQIRKKTDSYVSSSRNTTSSTKVSTKSTQSKTTKTTSKPKTIASASTTTSTSYTNVSASSVVNSAKNYIGTPYRSGGTSSSGMDCSGLVVTSFKENGKEVPRISRDQANAGKTVSVNEAQPGDLIFFNTSGRGISHVGIVESVKNGELFFVHSSSSKGVMISSLESSYWKPRFVKVVRID